MARIRWVDEPDATGDAAAAYGEWFEAHPGRAEMPGILKCLSLRPDLLRQMDAVSDSLHFTDGHLSVRIKEMIATLVSALNRCPYCAGSHAYFLQLQDPDARVRQCLARADLETAPIAEEERLLLRFAEKVAAHSDRTTDEDVAALRLAGWTDPQIAEAVYVAALFSFFNRVANSFGLDDPGFFASPPPWWPTPEGDRS